MNKTYRTVWNATTGTWTATSELAKSRTKPKSSVKPAVTAVVAAVAGMGGGVVSLDADAAAANGNGGLALCGATTGIGYGPSSSSALNCSPAVTGQYTRLYQGRAPAFGLYNNSGANGTSAGQADAGTEAGISGSKDGHLVLLGGAGVHVVGAADFSANVNMTNNRIQNLAAGTAGTDAVNLNQLNAAVAGTNNPYVVTNTGLYASATAAKAGESATAIGAGANGSGRSAVAVGGNTIATGLNSVAVGTLANVSGAEGIAVGVGANTSSTYGVALGRSATASAYGAVALGNGAVADRENTVSVGSGSGQRAIVNMARGTRANDAVNVSQLTPVVTALGGGATLNTSNGTVTGPTYNLTNGGRQTTVGGALSALDSSISTKVGNRFVKVDGTVDATATGNRANIAIGNSASSTAGTSSSASIAMGSNANASNAGAISIGTNSAASGSGGAALGVRSTASGASATALGVDSSATAANSVALGAFSIADRDNSVSVGSAALQRQITNVAAGTQNTDAVNLGQMNAALAPKVDNTYIKVNTGLYAAAVAAQAGSSATAIGANANANALSAVALGGNTFAAQNGTAIGTIAQARGANSTAVGLNASAQGQDSTAFGAYSVASSPEDSTYTMAIGAHSTASARAATAIGTYSVADGDHASTLGMSASAGGSHSVALGAYSVADRDDSVSVGSSTRQRQITNLAAGTEGTDAVNLDQLNAAIANVGPVTNAYFKANGAGDGSDDARAVGVGSVAIGANASTVADGAVAIGKGATAAENAVALGNGSAATIANTVSVGSVGNERKIVNVGEGDLTATSTDAVNGAQLYATNTRVGSLEDALKEGGVIDPTTGESLAVVYDGTAKDKVTLAGATGTTLSNVKAGVADMDAVNVSQLKDSGLIGEDGKSIAAVTYDRNADGTPNYGSVTLGDGNGPVKVTNVADATGDSDALNLGQLKQAGLVGDDGQGNLTSLAVTYDDASKDKVTLGGGAAGTTITNVKAGELSAASTDAVNGSQLFATNQDIGDLRDSLKEGGVIDPTTGESLAVVYDGTTKDKVTLAGATGTTLSNVKAGVADMDAVNVSQLKDSGLIGEDGKSIAAVTYDRNADGTPNYGSVTLGGANASTPVALKNVATGVDGTDAVNVDQMTDGLTKLKDEIDGAGLRFVKVNADPATGTPALATGALAVAIGAGAAGSGAHALALGTGARASGLDSVAIGYNSVANEVNTVSVGRVGGERRIVNVANGNIGVDSTDAVNGGQLYAAMNNLSTSMDAKTQQAIDDFSASLDEQTQAAKNRANARSMDLMDVRDPLVAVEGLQGENLASLNGADPNTTTAAAIGSSSVASGGNAVAVGLQNVAGSDNSVAIGSFAQTGAGQAYSVAMGSDAQTNGTQAVALGAHVQANADRAVAVGNNNTWALGDSSIALGDSAKARTGATNSVAVGTNANVAANVRNAMALGANANVEAGATGGIALGAGSVANRGNALSIGTAGAERQIINVAAGTQQTDAVNVSQLTGVTTALGGGAAVGADGSITQPTYTVGGNDYHNVSDALDALAQNGDANAVAYDDASKDTVTLAGANGTTLSNVKAGVADMDAVNVGQLKGSGLIGEDGKSIAAVTYDRNADGTPNYGSVTLGDGNGPVKVTNVADATGDSDALNLGQLKQAGLVGDDGQGNLTSLAVTYDDASKDKVTLGGGAAGTTITNVKAGELSAASTDAVNGSQLFATNQDIGNLRDSLKDGGVIDPTTGASLAVVYDSAAKNRVTLGGAGASNPVVLSNVAQGVAGTDAVNVDQLTDALRDLDTGLNPLAVSYDTAGKDRVTLAGTEGTTLSNVAAGIADMDAVNVSQLKDSGLIGEDGKSIAAVTYDRNADGTPNYGSVTLGNGDGPTQIKNVADATEDGDATNLGQLKKAGLVGDDGQGNLTSLAVAYDDASKGTVTLGGGAAGTTITNVKAGELSATSTDAVNGSQLYATNQSIGNLSDSLKDGGVIDPTTGESLAVVYDGTAKDTVTLAGANGTTLSNVKAGVADMDAVNVSQLKDSGLIGEDGKSIAAVTYDRNADGTANYGSVTLGNGNGPTQIKNVADATDNGDALNLGQLKQAGLVGDDGQGNLTSLAVTYDGTAKDTVTLAGTNGTTLSNVKAGVADMDAVNVSQLKGSGLIGEDGKSIAAVTYDRNADGTANYGSVTLGNGDGPTQIKNVADATEDGDATNLGQLKKAGLVGDDGQGNLTSLAVAYDDATKGTVTLGGGAAGTTITNVKAGELSATSTDAVNGSQLFATNQDIGDLRDSLKDGGVIDPTTGESLAVVYDGTAKDKVTLAGANGTTLSNVKAGVADMDAVNVSQLKGSGLIGEDGKSIAAVTYDRNADGTPNYGSVTLGNGNGPTQIKNVADATDNGDAVNYGQMKQYVDDNAGGPGNALAVAYDDTSKDAITLAGTDGTTITNVKAGDVSATSTDAINGSQLHGVSQSVADALGGGATVGADGTVTNPTYSLADRADASQQSEYHNVGDALANLDGRVVDNTTNITVIKNQLADSGLIDPATGQSIAAVTYDRNADGTPNYGSATLRGTDGTTLSNVKAGVADMDAVNVSQLKGSGLIGEDGKSIAAVTYDRNADGTANYGSVTLGNGNGPTQIKNVADATDDGDATNLGQLKKAGLVGDDGQGNLTSLAVAYDDASKGTITLGGGAAGTTITNVKAGELSATSTDAVNGSQLYATNQSIGNLSDSLKDGGVIDPTTGESLAVVYDSAAKNQVTLGGKDATKPVQLKNVAAGTDGTDAVNVAQLKEAGLVAPVDPTDPGAGLTSLAVTYTDASKSVVTLGGADGTTLTNVKAGAVNATSTDAINGAQLHGVSQSVADSLGGGATVGADGTVTNPTYSLADPADASQKTEYHNVGDALTNLDGRVVDNTTNITVIKNQLADSGLVDPVTGQSIAAVTYDRNADGTPNYGSVTLGNGNGPVRVSNVANGVDRNDAVNVGQLQDAGLVAPVDPGKPGTMTSLAVTYDKQTDGTANFDRITLAGANGTTLTNVKAGAVNATSTDAVNGAQLHGVAQSVADSLGGGSTVDPDGKVTSPTYVVNNQTFNNVGDAITNISNSLTDGSIGLVQQDETTRDITVAKDTDGTVVDFAGTAGDRVLTGVAAGAVNATSNDAINGSQLHGTAQSVADTIGGGTTVDVDGKLANTAIEVNGSKYSTVAEAVQAAAAYGATDSLAVRYDLNADGTPNFGSVTLGGSGAAPVVLTNVANGVNQYDAVNFGQLSELNDKIGNMDDRVGALEQNPGNGGGSGGGSGDNPYFAGTDVTPGSSTAANAGTGTGNTAAGSGANVGSGANNATVVGSNASASNDNATVIGSGAKSTGEGSTAIGQGSNASGSGSVAIGQGSVATEANTVSFGNGTDEGNRRIVNIADGINANDAASKGQLDRAVGGLQGQINDVSKNAYSGIAAATALTMIPGVDPGKTLSFGVGGATYKGYQAVAFGGEARITQNLKMKAGVGLSSGGNTVGVGASYQW